MKTVVVSDSKRSKKNSANKKAPALIKISNNLCYDNTHEIIGDVSRLILQYPKQLILDFSDVEVMDSSGLRALLECRRMCEKANIELRLVSISVCIARIINMSGFGKTFGISQMDPNNHQALDLVNVDFEAQGWDIAEYVATSDPSVIAILRSKVRDAAVKAGARDDVLCDIQIAAGEALTNAFKHGSPVKGTDKITLRCMSCGRALVVEVEDEGTPFNPDAVAEPDPKLMRESGMGIYIMRQAMDAVEFQSGCPGNKVRLVKRLDSEDALNGKPEDSACQLTLLT